jgi:predicted nucleotidyltransferase
MTRQDILQVLAEHKELMQMKMGVKRIGLFGSYAREEANEGSDVDILVELDSPDFEKLMDLQLFLENSLDKSIDLLRIGPHLRPGFLADIEKEVVYA